MIWAVFGVALAGPELPLPTTSPVDGRRLLAEMPAAGRERTRLVGAAILEGQVPAASRALAPVSWQGTDEDGQMHDVTVWVTSDFLCVGASEPVYAPLDLPEARRIGRATEAVLPTRRISDAIWGAADTTLRPSPIPPSPAMATTSVLLTHQDTIDAQLPATPGLVAGHKKDLVLTRGLQRSPDRVAIYGWHRRTGRPIQPVSLWHGSRYVDYSHGVRLVSRWMEIDGVRHDLLDVLGNRRLARLVSDEGPLPRTLLDRWRH